MPYRLIDVINDHLDLCNEVSDVLLEENRILRATGDRPGNAFLQRKRNLLPRLKVSAEALREINRAGDKASEKERPLIDLAQKRILKILLLDRENEQLLLRAAENGKPAPRRQPPPASRAELLKAYKQRLATS